MFLAHDVGRSRDRSTAVIGGPCPHTAFVPDMLRFGEFWELPQGLFSSGRASALAAVDREWNYIASGPALLDSVANGAKRSPAST